MKKLMKKFEDMMVAITFAEAGELVLDEGRETKKVKEMEGREEHNVQPTVLRTGA